MDSSALSDWKLCVPVSASKKDNNLFFIYSNLSTKKAKYSNKIMPIIDMEIKRNKFIPETKIKIIQLNPINNVCPRSGWTTNSKIIEDVNKKEIIKWELEIKKKNLIIIPLKIFFKKGRAKINIGIGKSKKKFDKRETIRKREEMRDIERTRKANKWPL